MVPPPEETRRVAVERARRVLGDVEFKNGHMERDCRNRESMSRIVQVYKDEER